MFGRSLGKAILVLTGGVPWTRSVRGTTKLCGANEAQRSLRPNQRFVYARHGRELMG